MKKVVHHCGADLDWVDSFAKTLNGKVEGNFIVVPNNIHSGSRYFIKCEEGVVVQYIDITYKTHLQITQRNKKNDFIAIYYNLSEGNPKLSIDTASAEMGSWSNNFLVFDSSLEFKYEIKSGVKSFVFCIFIKKEILKLYAQKNSLCQKKIDAMINSRKNTFIRLDRMSNENYHLLMELRKLEVGGLAFDLNLMGTTYMLISDYLKRIETESLIIRTVNNFDLASIISAQKYLLDNILNHFPSTKSMAEKFNMSESKFKTLFKKITGIPPSTYFMDNKLYKAKELLEQRRFTIVEISKQLNFSDGSYFAYRFKTKFGITPKIFMQQLTNS